MLLIVIYARRAKGLVVEFRNFVLASLTDADAGALLPSLREMSVARGQLLYEQGDRVESVYFPSSAVLSSVTVMRDGRSAESGTHGRESVIGLLPALIAGVSTTRIFAQVGGALMRLSAADLRGALRASESLQAVMARHLAAAVMQAEQTVACNVLHPAQSRLARWLLLTADRVGADSFMLTQDYLAVMVGVQRSTISVLAGGLKAMGLIGYSRGQVSITDRPGLEAAACECYGVLNSKYLDITRPDAPRADLARAPL